MNKKSIFFLVLLFSLLIIIPSSFAEELDKDGIYESNNQIDENNLQIDIANNEDIELCEADDSLNNNVLTTDNTENELGATDNDILSSNQINLKIVAKPLTVKYSKNKITYNFKIYNEANNKPLKNVNFDFNVYGNVDKYYHGTSGKNGLCTVKIDPLKSGTYYLVINAYSPTDKNGDPYCIDTKLTVKSTKNTKITPSVSAPKINAYYKDNKYFKITVKKNGKAVNKLTLKVKVYTGNKYKTYTLKTKNGVAKISTKNLKVGTHKVKITSGNSKYKISKTSKIVIKKKISYTSFKSPSGYKWKIKTSAWNKMKKEATKNYNFFKSVGSGRPGYSDSSVTVKLTRNGNTYTGTAYAVKNSNYMRCEIRGAVTGVYISDKGDQIV